jgi:hypothetical protein
MCKTRHASIDNFCLFRKPDFYIFHVVWYCDTCLAIVYGNRAQNFTLIQLYDIEKVHNNDNNERILLKARFIDETRKGSLLSRFLKPYFSPSGIFAFIVRFDPLTTDRATQKSYPHIVRIHFNQTVDSNHLR